jgi:orotate phosphoribosyltransferase
MHRRGRATGLGSRHRRAMSERYAACEDVPMGGVDELVSARTGHFRLESGHHGSLWLQLDSLFVEPTRIEPHLRRLAQRVAAHDVEAVCGQLTGGAFAAQSIARELGALFVYAVPAPQPSDVALYMRGYEIPDTLAAKLPQRRVALIDDVINAGSATKATLAAIEAAGGKVVTVGALLTLGDVGTSLFSAKGIPVESLETRANPIWAPTACPLCAAGTPLDHI